MADRVRGQIKFGRRTKELVRELQPGDIAVIHHEDIDELAATSLIERRVGAVVNFAKSLSGRYPCPGPKLLLEAGIPLLDCADPALRTILEKSGSHEGSVDHEGVLLGDCRFRATWRDADWVEATLASTREQMQWELARFVENTLEYARRDLHSILQPQRLPPLNTTLSGRHVLVVVRGKAYKEDLNAIRGYIAEFRPVLIGVDGGADALRDLGWSPDIILGDMDSVSDEALQSRAEVVLHAYLDGTAPGRERLEKLGRPYTVFPVVGTSEDAALLLAYELGAQLIVAVGTHTSAVDFLEKGRPGMASTLLVRLKVAPILVDAKGVSQIYRRRFRGRYAAALALGALIPVGAMIAVLTPLQLLVRLLILKLRLWTGW